jgi:hypothetical protein
MARPEYQNRVVMERQELIEKIDKLTDFMKGGVFVGLDEDEQDRLSRQHVIMLEYSNILAERIVHF